MKISKYFKHLELILLLALVGFSIYTVRHIFSPGLPMGWDTPGHYLRAKFFSENLDLNGWFPYSLTGHPIFQFKPPLPYILPSMLNVLPIGFENSFKIVMVLFYALLPVAVYFFARSFGHGSVGALSAALFSLFLDNIYGVGISSIFGIGLLQHAFGIVILLVALSFMHKAVTTGKPNNVILAGISLSFLILTHVFSAYAYAFFVAAYLAIMLAYAKTIPNHRVLCVVVTAFFLSAFWIFPFVARNAYHGMVVPWSAPTISWVIQGVLDGTLTGSKLITLFGTAGMAIALVRRRFQDIYLLVMASLMFLFSAGAVPNNIVPLAGEISVRYLPFFAVMLVVLGGLAVETAFTFLKRRSGKYGYLFMLAFLLTIAFTGVPQLIQLSKDSVRVESDNPSNRYVMDAAFWINQNTPALTRMASEFNWGASIRYGNPNIISFYVPVHSKRYELRGFAEDIKTSYEINLLTDNYIPSAKDTELIRSQLKEYGIGYLVTISGNTGQKFQDDDNFKKTFEADDTNIFELTGKPNFFLTSGAEVLSFASFGNGFEYLLKNTFPGKPVSIAVSYYPNWNVYIDGKKGKIVQTEKNLMQIFLDSPSLHKVRFAYEPGAIEKWSMVVSFVAWISVICLLLRKK